MVPLNFSDIGEENIIKKIGGNAEMKKHLTNLGFVVGGKVKVLQRISGNLIVCVKNVRIGIGEDIARKIMI